GARDELLVALALLARELPLALREQLLPGVEVGARLSNVLLEGGDLCFALLEPLQDATRLLPLYARLFERRRVLLRLVLELLHPRRQLARLVRELELALVELARPRDEPFLALAALRGALRLALLEHLLSGLALDAGLGRCPSACFRSWTLRSMSCSRSAICFSSFASFSFSSSAPSSPASRCAIWPSRSSGSASVPASAAARRSSAAAVPATSCSSRTS